MFFIKGLPGNGLPFATIFFTASNRYISGSSLSAVIGERISPKTSVENSIFS